MPGLRGHGGQPGSCRKNTANGDERLASQGAQHRSQGGGLQRSPGQGSRERSLKRSLRAQANAGETSRKESLMCPHKKAGSDRRCMDDSQDTQAQARLDLLSVPHPLILEFWRSLRGAAQRQRGGGRTEKYQRTLMPMLLASEIPELGSGKKL